MKWIKYQIHTTTDAAENIGGILYELGITGYEITDHIPLTVEEEKKMFTDIPADVGFDDGLSTLTFYTEAEDNDKKEFFSTGSSLRDARLEEENAFIHIRPDKLIDKIKSRISDMQVYIPIEMPEFEYSIEDDSQWKDKWKENFKTFRAAENIIIKPTWEETPLDVSKDDIVVEINPGSAFGTGTHETTKLCLRLLKEYIDTDTTILDAGCGSGILAISALLLGAKSACCMDIDILAVEATKENALNNIIKEDKLKAICANVLEDEELIKSNFDLPVDIAVANILADVIVVLSECIGNFIKDGGLFISSGILIEKANEVEAALIKNNFEIMKKDTLGEWAAFVARKSC